MHRRTTLILDEALLERAGRLTGIQEKTALVHAGLEALVARAAARQSVTPSSVIVLADTSVGSITGGAAMRASSTTIRSCSTPSCSAS